ncbi:MAG: LPS assembly lipoprotein LptE [Candidatus Omnitrophica bacterium]|jgi:outer membrane lipopolysaccharide assembly protein LptE/RlpB|nr:LPS assembly lipoprotein LptE [Candidatus Omnitrophota bacterium]
MKKLLIFAFILLCGCGYTTRGFVYSSNKIYIAPAVNKINITSEDRRYSTFTAYPVLLEQRLTNKIINKFNIDGHLKVVSEEGDNLKLFSEVTEYLKETMRYNDSEDVKEQRLRLHVKMKLLGPDGNVIKEREIVGETSFFLTGPNSISETTAQEKLIDDTSRRILEVVVEEW